MERQLHQALTNPPLDLQWRFVWPQSYASPAGYVGVAAALTLSALAIDFADVI
jgi:hypothetical protein